MKTVSIIAMLLLLGIMVTFVGCGEGSALVGKWEGEGYKVYGQEELAKDTIEFFKDGTVIFGSKKLEWKISKDQLILSEYSYVQTYNYKISGSTLTLTDDGGDEEIYKKVKK